MTDKGDLISREALKIEIEKQIAYCDDKSKHQSDMEEVLRYSNTSYGLRLAHNYIDNAPTVEPKKEIVPVCKVTFDKEQLQEIVDKKVAEMIERLQGEWVFMRGVTCGGYYKCNKCGEVERAEKNYCPNCGALMMKGGKEE